MAEFITIANNAESRTTIKNSLFVSRCQRVTSASEALAFVQQVRRENVDATHNCWAYRINANEYRFNDDGEPGGSAGQPIFQAILGLSLEQVCIVVTRYYGGVKLGVGGLVRAYGGGAAAVLKEAGTILIKPQVELMIIVPFAEQSALYHFLERNSEITLLNSDYTTNGLQLTIKLYADIAEQVTSNLRDALRGRVEIQQLPSI